MERTVLITGDHEDFVSSGQGLHVMMMGGGVGIVRTLVDSNVLWMNRGVGIYVEDGNEMNNTISHNTVICPYWDPAKRWAGVEGPYCQVQGANAGFGVGIYMI